MTRYLIDTNVLLRSAVNTSARNPSAAGAIAVLLAQGDELLLAPQVLMEFWSVATRPVAVNGQVVVRPMMYVALSYDHRVVDGRDAVTFLVRLKQAIEDPARLLLSV